MSLEKNKTAGDDVDSRCLKCKAVTNHTIIAMTGDTIAKVLCNTCGARHNFRAPVDEKKKASSTKVRRDGVVKVSSRATPKAKTVKGPSKKALQAAVDFETLIQDKDISAAISYAIDVSLAPGYLVNHSVFGLGVVTEIMQPDKAHITFREHGAKLMACKLND